MWVPDLGGRGPQSLSIWVPDGGWAGPQTPGYVGARWEEGEQDLRPLGTWVPDPWAHAFQRGGQDPLGPGHMGARWEGGAGPQTTGTLGTLGYVGARPGVGRNPSPLSCLPLSLPASRSTLGPSPPTRPSPRRREERRGLLLLGHPGPVAPRFARWPPPRPWRRRRVLSPPRPEAEGLF